MPDHFAPEVVWRTDTLWKFARAHMPDTDPWQGVEWIRQVNGLGNYVVRPGDILNIPDWGGPLIEPMGPSCSSPEIAQAAADLFRALLDESRMAVEDAERWEAQEDLRRAPVHQVSRGMAFKEITMLATAYSNDFRSTGKRPGDSGYGVTATGMPSDRGTVATDPKIIPPKSLVWVEGYGYAVVLDRGGAIKGNRIDVFFWEEKMADEWGRRRVRVRVLQ